MTPRRTWIAGSAILATIAVCGAQQQPRPELIPRDREIAMALSAAPSHLRADATVYVLESTGYILAKKGTNGFTCLVNRGHPLSQRPTCWDSEGSETIVPTVLHEGELLMRGKTVEEIKADIKSGFETGRFVAPRRPGVAYMLAVSQVYNPATKKVEAFPPHVMFYAPNLTDADIGSKGRGEDGLPFISDPGPRGYMITLVPSPEQHASHQ